MFCIFRYSAVPVVNIFLQRLPNPGKSAKPARCGNLCNLLMILHHSLLLLKAQHESLSIKLCQIYGGMSSPASYVLHLIGKSLSGILSLPTGVMPCSPPMVTLKELTSTLMN